MQGEGWRASTYVGLQVAAVIVALVGGIFGLATGAPEASELAHDASLLQTTGVAWAQSLRPHAWWVVPLASVVAPGLHWLRRWIGAPWVWGVVNVALNSIHAQLFDEYDGPEHAHRVTLFRYRKWRLGFDPWPSFGWLVPVARSGHTTRSTRARFRAPSEPSHATGVAGTAFVGRGILVVPGNGDPALPALTSGATDKKIRDYSSRSFTDENWVRARLKGRPRSLPRSFAGIPVEVSEQPWGVIVIDSANPSIDRERVEKSFRTIAGTLSKVLEGVI